MKWIAFFCITLLLITFGLQYALHWQPCPLCQLQRMVYAAVGCLAGFAALHANLTRKPVKVFYVWLIGLLLIAGIVISLRHLWIQAHPNDFVQGCIPPLSYLLQHMPWTKAMTLLLHAEGSCANATERIAGITLPAWALWGWLVCFYALYQARRKIKK